jgi:hypothetical protein
LASSSDTKLAHWHLDCIAGRSLPSSIAAWSSNPVAAAALAAERQSTACHLGLK